MLANSGVRYKNDAVRIRVNKPGKNPEFKKFSIDPQITSFEVLQSIIAKAFEIQGDFALSYKALDSYGQETLLPLLSDWDLDAAFIGASDPCLTINIDSKGHRERTESVHSIDIPRTLPSLKPATNRLPGLIMNRMEKTLHIFQKALTNLTEEPTGEASKQRRPLTDAQFRTFLDSIGQISNLKDLKTSIYFGGVEDSLRKVVWKHILNVYPLGMSGRERMDYMKRKSLEYESLKNRWREALKSNCVQEELSYVTGMVRKDVLRTDRHLKFYAGSDDNQNITSLFNILTTYALNHPSVSYCQGMSDLASPLLVTMGDEAHAYICFCALMFRLKPNFQIDGATMTLKFQHLTDALKQCDPVFYKYLESHQADDLLFCYRWLLLEMKREFAFENALHMLEVLWSSVDCVPLTEELKLFEVPFNADSGPVSAALKNPRENHYTKVRLLRRQNSSQSVSQRIRKNQSFEEPVEKTLGHIKPFFSLDDNCVLQMNSKPPENALALMKKQILENRGPLSSSTGDLNDSQEPSTRKTLSLGKLEHEEGKTRPHKKSVKNFNEFLNFVKVRGPQFRRSQCSSISESIDDGKVGSPSAESSSSCTVFDEEFSSSTDSSPEYCPVEDSLTKELRKELDQLDRSVLGEPTQKNDSDENDIYIWENHLATDEPPLTSNKPETTSFLMMGANTTTNLINSLRSSNLKLNSRALGQLPPPSEFGAGNPFLMFLCLTLLRQHRDYIMRTQMDYNEMAMHFDKMVRRHDVRAVLNEARQMFAAYLKQHAGSKGSVNGDVQV